jgi:hypothetical protein
MIVLNKNKSEFSPSDNFDFLSTEQDDILNYTIKGNRNVWYNNEVNLSMKEFYKTIQQKYFNEIKSNNVIFIDCSVIFPNGNSNFIFDIIKKIKNELKFKNLISKNIEEIIDNLYKNERSNVDYENFFRELFNSGIDFKIIIYYPNFEQIINVLHEADFNFLEIISSNENFNLCFLIFTESDYSTNNENNAKNRFIKSFIHRIRGKLSENEFDVRFSTMMNEISGSLNNESRYQEIIHDEIKEKLSIYSEFNPVVLDNIKDELIENINHNQNLSVNKIIDELLESKNREIMNTNINDEFIEKLFEETDIEKVISGANEISEANFEKYKLNKKCLIKKLEKRKLKLIRQQDNLPKNSILKVIKKKFIKEEFEIKLLFKIFNFLPIMKNIKINPSLFKNHFFYAIRKSLFCKFKIIIIPSLIIILLLTILYFTYYFQMFDSIFKKDIQLNLKVLCKDTTICYDKNLEVELSFPETQKFDINLKNGDVINPPVYNGKKNDEIIVNIVGTSEFKLITDTIYLKPYLQYIFVERNCKCDENGFKPNIYIKKNNNILFEGEVTIGIENQPVYKVFKGKVDFTNNIDCKYFNTKVKIWTIENNLFDTTLLLNDCNLIEIPTK